MTAVDSAGRRAPGADFLEVGPGPAPVVAFGVTAPDPAAVPGLDQVLGVVLEHAVIGVHCDWATIKLRPTKRAAAITVTSAPRVAPAGPARRVGDDETTGSRDCSVHAVELAFGRKALGVIAFYANHSKGFTAADTEAARLIAIHAALTIAAVRNSLDLLEAIGSRTVIARAQGVLMERFGLDDARAFQVLRRHSQDHNVKLRDIAHGLVASGHLPDDRPRGGPRR